MYFPDALLICSLPVFLFHVCGSKHCMGVGVVLDGAWVENSDIKKRFFKVATPEIISCNV